MFNNINDPIHRETKDRKQKTVQRVVERVIKRVIKMATKMLHIQKTKI
jgi:hypothetical protein